MRKRALKRILLACSLVAFAELVFLAFGRDMIPSRLTVHPPHQGWRSVILDGNPVSATGASDCVVPIVYGPHDLQIELADGKMIWAEFFYSDTGVVRHIDIYLDYVPGRDTATLRETETRYMTFPGITGTVSTGRVHPKMTSPAEPLTLEWI